MRTMSIGENRVVVAVDGETGNTVFAAAATSVGNESGTLGCWSTTYIQFDLLRISC